MSRPSYPFEPKSNRFLIPGQFWGIPLSNGTFAAGRVIEVNPKDRSTFLAGLMDWVGPNPPTDPDLAGRRTLVQGLAHYLTIVDTGPAILGHRALALDDLEPDLMLDRGGWRPWLQRGGFELLRPATREEWAMLRVCGGWGRLSVKVMAERLLVRREPLLEGRPDVEEWLQANPRRPS